MFEVLEQEAHTNPLILMVELFPKFCSALYDRPDIQSLMEEDFDLVITQPISNDCSLGLVHKIISKNNAPLILFTPVGAPGYLVDKIGGFYPPSFVPNLFLSLRDEMTFYERFTNTAANLIFDATYYFYYLPVMEKVYRDKLGQDFPSAPEILDKASLILSNSHFSTSKPRPNLPNVLDVGGIHSRVAEPLPKELEEFVSGGSDGFILFSLGTGLKSSEMPIEKRNIFANVFRRLKQRVVWKYEDDGFTHPPENVKLMKWVPQQDLLGHKNIKLFITHCGLGGMEEAIFHAVPLVGMPFFGDQLLNAQEAENNGYLFRMVWKEITEESLEHGIKEVLNNPKYLESVQRLSNVFRDQIDNPLERAFWWVEYVIRYNGAPQLRSAARKLNFFQYHSFDVYASFLLLIFVLIYLSWKVVKFAWRKLRKGGTKADSDELWKKLN